jgi:hypothetical protein
LEFSVGSTYKTYNFAEVVDWVHLAVSYSNITDQLKVYKNGVQVGSGLQGGTYIDVPASAFNYKIGENSSGMNDFSGGIADLREYDREITGAEVADIYAGTHVSSGLIGWWLTDTDDVLDHSGSGNNGTNNGSTYSTDGPLDP